MLGKALQNAQRVQLDPQYRNLRDGIASPGRFPGVAIQCGTSTGDRNHP